MDLPESDAGVTPAETEFPKAVLRRIGSYVNYKFIQLDKSEVVVGRAKESTCNIADLLISRRHAIFKVVKDEWTVESVGMNGIAINHVTLPKHQPIPLSHLDVIELGAGSKFVYAFRLLSAETNEPHAKRRRLPLIDRNLPSLKDCPEAFHSWLTSKRNLERTLVEENDELDQKLVETSSREDQLVLEQKKLTEYSEKVTKQLESQFAEEKKQLEDKVRCGEMEKNVLQMEKLALEDRMTTSLKEFEAECLRKSQLLEESVAQANAEKQALLDQKEIVVQQLQRENEVLEARLEEERRSSAATVGELTKMRESLEQQLQQERQKFEEEKTLLLQQGSEAESRLSRLEEERTEREKLLISTKADLEAKEREVVDIQNRAAIGLDVYQAIQDLNQGPNPGNIIMLLEDEKGPNGEAIDSDAPNATELELVEMREKLRATVAEKELIEQQLKNASTKARSDFVGKLEDVVENELQCGICSELLVFAVSLNCMHTFCQFCISQWKKNKVECPICRAPIKTEGRSFVIDSAIDGIVSTLSEEMQRRRKELVQQRREIANQAAVIKSQKTAQQSGRTQRTHRRPSQPAQPSQPSQPSQSTQRTGGVEFVRPARMSRYALYPAAGPSQEPQGPSQVRQSVTTRSTRQATVPSQGVHPRATIVRPVSNPPPHYGGSMYVARPPTHSVPFASRR